VAEVCTADQDRALADRPGGGAPEQTRIQNGQFRESRPPIMVVAVVLLVDHLLVLARVFAAICMFWVFRMRSREPKPDSATV
jgi:hypothetical protein